jgi:diguanylate cyclase (GGDEF)-like protein
MGNLQDPGNGLPGSPPRAGADMRGYTAERDLRNTEAVQFGATLALVIDALTYSVRLVSGQPDPAGAMEFAIFLTVLVVSAAYLLRSTLDLRDGHAMSPAACGAFWIVVVGAGSAGWAAALGDLRGFIAYASALLGTAMLYRAPRKLALGLFLGAAAAMTAYIPVHPEAGRAVLLIAYAVLYAVLAFVISMRFERDHRRLFQARQELAERNAALQEMSLRDPLTQLFNRRYFMEALAHEMKLVRREHRLVGVAMIDADHFKRINDELGHAAGDLVLKDLSLVMLDVLRGSDIVARYGGEEFLVILAGCDLERARFAAERLRRAVELRVTAGVPWKVTVSIGVTVIRDLDTEETLIQRVDALLYRAKETGRNQVRAD